jgi:hypothetical protein
MTEYKFANQPAFGGKTVAALRVFLWACVVMLLGLGAYAVFGPLSPDRTTVVMLARLACFLVTVAVLLVYFFGRKIGIAEQRQKSSFLLTEEDLTYRREGWPDIQIALSSISSVTESSDGLRVISSEDSFVGFRVPRELDGYGSLRSALQKHQVIKSERPSSSVRRFLAASVGIGIPLLLVITIFTQRPNAILIVFGCYIAWLVGTSLYTSYRKS